MFKHTAPVALTAILASITAAADAKESVTIVYTAGDTSITEFKEPLVRSFKLMATPMVEKNTIVIEAMKEDRERILQFLRSLDTPKSMLAVSVYLVSMEYDQVGNVVPNLSGTKADVAKYIDAANGGALNTETHIELVALENLETQIQTGSQIQRTSSSGRSTSFAIGTMVSLRYRSIPHTQQASVDKLLPRGALMNIDVEKTDFLNDAVQTFSHQTTLKSDTGMARITASLRNEKTNRVLCLVVAIDDALKAPPARRAQTASRLTQPPASRPSGRMIGKPGAGGERRESADHHEGHSDRDHAGGERRESADHHEGHSDRDRHHARDDSQHADEAPAKGRESQTLRNLKGLQKMFMRKFDTDKDGTIGPDEIDDLRDATIFRRQIPESIVALSERKLGDFLMSAFASRIRGQAPSGKRMTPDEFISEAIRNVLPDFDAIGASPSDRKEGR